MNIKERYSRHFLIPDFEEQHQQQLLDSKVIVVGAGGLGTPVLLYLAAAGVGHITLVDDDVVSESNLQRQVLYNEQDLGKSKAEIAANKISLINSSLKVMVIIERFTTDNATKLLEGKDLLVDCTDNFKSRLVFQESCKQSNIPWIHASIENYSGNLVVFQPNSPFSYSDLFNMNEEVEQRIPGVIGALPGVIGSWQAMEALKLLSGKGQKKQELLRINLLENQCDRIDLGELI